MLNLNLLNLSRCLYSLIASVAQTAHPREACGILLGPASTGLVFTVLEVVPVHNFAPQPRWHYLIAPEDILDVQTDARDRGLSVLGYFHSHPDARAVPSSEDLAVAQAGKSDGVLHVIVAVTEKGVEEIAAWVFLGGHDGHFSHVNIERMEDKE